MTAPSYPCHVAQQPLPAKYRQIAADLLARIEAGEYPVGENLPAKPELMKSYGAALGTIDHALAELRGMGMVQSRQGIGTSVVRQHPEATEPEPDGVKAALVRLEGNLIDLYGKLGYDYPREDTEPEPGSEAVAHDGRA